jgi:serine/threonine protein kinase
MYDFFSPDVQDLLHGLLRRDPKKRISNASDVKKHKWFKKINWDDVSEKKVKPIFKPVVKSEEDCSNIDMQFLREEIKETMPMRDMSSFHTRQ